LQYWNFLNPLASRVLLCYCSALGAAMGITCKATIRLICEYLEGRLAPEVGAEVQRHLSHCEYCRTIFDAAALTLEVYFDREVEAVPADRTRVA
jgi:predicted anti-sigma-YlaC factor YlaD